MKKMNFYVLCTMVIVLFVAQIADAQQKNIQLPKRLLPEWEVSTTLSVVGDAEFENSSASYSKTRAQAVAKYRDFTFTYRKDMYSWDNTNSLNFGTDRSRDPWNSLQHLAVGYTTRTKLSTRGFLQYGGQLASNYEDSIDFDSLTGTAYVGYGYFLKKDLMLMFGVAGTVNAVDAYALPLVGVSYTTGPWEFLFGFPKTHVRYQLNDAFSLTAAAGFDYSVYNLSDRSPVEEDGYVEIRESKLSLIADWCPLENFQLSLGPELYFARSMRIYDSGGDQQGGTQDSDLALGLRAGITFEF